MPTYQRILDTEDLNEDKIYLYKAGRFWKAYNQSAYLFHTYIQSFKLSSRIVQKINRRVVSLGFPEEAFKKYTYSYLVEKVDQECLRVHLGKRIDETSFDQCAEGLSKNVRNPLGLRAKERPQPLHQTTNLS